MTKLLTVLLCSVAAYHGYAQNTASPGQGRSLNYNLIGSSPVLISSGNVLQKYNGQMPAEGKTLNYRLVGFSEPDQGNKNSKIEVASGNRATDGDFRKHIICTLVCRNSKVVAEMPSFGEEYTWRSVSLNDKAVIYGPLHHFATGNSPLIDSTRLRLRIITPAKSYKDAYVYFDGSPALFNVKGQPVWYFPDSLSDLVPTLRDLKISPAGTITFLSNRGAYEIDYDGNVLWKAPDNGLVSGESKESYHHEFSRLSNGHYMIMGIENVLLKPSEGGQSIIPGIRDSVENARLVNVPFSTLIEYDAQGKVVWTWRASNYFLHSDLAAYSAATGSAAPEVAHMHGNSFFFDEKNKMIYIGFKDISRIVKIKYPDGVVSNEYGEKYVAGAPVPENKLYKNQHACKRAAVGCLFLFNNNGGVKVPMVKKFTEPVSSKEPLKKIWEYTCPLEKDVPVEFHTGGSVEDMPDQSLFVCMGSRYNKMFIVDTNKTELWSALPETWEQAAHSWKAMPGYRGIIISEPKELERLVLGTQKTGR